VRIALVVGREVTEERSWGIVLRELLTEGHIVVGLAQPFPSELAAFNEGNVELFPRDIVTDDYLKIPIEAKGATQLSEYFRQDEYPQTHAILMGMLSRRDSSGTFRTLDREIVLRRLQLALLSQLLRANPSHIIFEETPHEAADFALFRLAQSRGIPVLFFQPSLVGPQVVARTSLFDVLPVESPLIGPADFLDARSAVKAISLRAISKLHVEGGTPQLDRQKRVDVRSAGPRQMIRALRHATSRFATKKSNPGTALTGHYLLPEGLRRGIEILLEWSLRKSLVQTVAGLPNTSREDDYPFAIFGLHYEPERTNMPEGLPYLSQLDAVLEARRFLPPTVKLLVKEHYSQQSSSLRGYVGRSPSAYDYLRSIPGIEVLGVAADSRSLMRQAECVFTMTGKIGIEAAFLGTPAVFFGQPWWREMPGSYSFYSLSSWTQLTQKPMPREADVQRWFEEQVSGRLLVGLGGTSPEKYSSRIAPLPESFEKLEAESILAAIRTFSARA